MEDDKEVLGERFTVKVDLRSDCCNRRHYVIFLLGFSHPDRRILRRRVLCRDIRLASFRPRNRISDCHIRQKVISPMRRGDLSIGVCPLSAIKQRTGKENKYGMVSCIGAATHRIHICLS